MAALPYSGNWQHLRKAIMASTFWVGTPCRRCGRPLWPGQRLQLGHVIDVADGGMGGPVVVEHGSCNEAAGARAGTARRQARRAKTRSKAEQEAHDHRESVRARREAQRARDVLQGPGRAW